MPNLVHNELTDRYLKRSALFWKFARDAKFSKWQRDARSAAWQQLDWNWEALGISEEGKQVATRLGFVPSEVFAHPEVLGANPELQNYYRLLACLPAKGLAQIKIKGERQNRLLNLCILLNRFVSKLLIQAGRTSRELLLRTIYAEAGSEWQGTWVNDIGQVAAFELEKIISDFATEKNLVLLEPGELRPEQENIILLKSGSTITFGSEPDVECRNANNELACVIEIKGSADKAGAQTRLGETKKSFTKAKRENARCVTIFLPTVLTPAVQDQLRTERDIDKVFELLPIFKEAEKRRAFLEELFRFCLREQFA
jgi:hypothetical protein